MRGRTPLVGIVVMFDQHAYQVIIDNHILPFMYDLHNGPKGWILQEKNCGSSRSKSAAKYLQNKEVTLMK